MDLTGPVGTGTFATSGNMPSAADLLPLPVTELEFDPESPPPKTACMTAAELGHRGAQRPGMSAYEPFVACMLQVKLQPPRSSEGPDEVGQYFLSVRAQLQAEAYRTSCAPWAVQATKLPTPSLPQRAAAACALQALSHVRYIPLQAWMCSVKAPPCKISASAQSKMAMFPGYERPDW